MAIAITLFLQSIEACTSSQKAIQPIDILVSCMWLRILETHNPEAAVKLTCRINERHNEGLLEVNIR